MPLPGLLDALKARDGVVLRMDDDRLPDDKRFRAGEKQGEVVRGTAILEVAARKTASVYSLLRPGRGRIGVQR